jgi:uncharacterized protein (DUF1800 family)
MLLSNWTPQRLLTGLVFLLLLGSGCGGGGGSSNPGVVTPPPAPPPAPPPSSAQLNAASKAASQATFGLPYVQIEALAEQGYDAWLNQQFAMPATLHRPVVDDLVQKLNNGELPPVDDDVEHLIQFRRYAWWNRAMTAPDVLRQRVAFALSEIFVVSDNVDTLIVYPHALSTYYDVLLANAFGNYRDLLEGIALHPAMGIYLSHVNNAKADPAANRFPDENFAREVMQLFSIGLFELNDDGSERLGNDGRPIPTYDNDDIREMAKIFTGLSYGGDEAFFGKQLPRFVVPMQMFDAQHESGEKRLLNGLVVAAGQTGTQDIQAAIDNLFNHSNVGPFIGKQLIQRLVTSNPSPDYIARVTAAFNGDATGVRGDMRAVLRAILTDDEAAIAPSGQLGGRLREPLVRFVSMARQLNATAEDGLFYNNGYLQQFLLRQHPLSSPSVFNFFLPGHSPAGELAAANLVAPEFQITDSTTIVSMTNLVELAVIGEFVMDIEDHFGGVSLDLSEFEDLARQSNSVLLDRLDLIFTHGSLSIDTRNVILGVMEDIADLNFKTKSAIYLVLISPDYSVDL